MNTCPANERSVEKTRPTAEIAVSVPDTVTCAFGRCRPSSCAFAVVAPSLPCVAAAPDSDTATFGRCAAVIFAAAVVAARASCTTGLPVSVTTTFGRCAPVVCAVSVVRFNCACVAAAPDSDTSTFGACASTCCADATTPSNSPFAAAAPSTATCAITDAGTSAAVATIPSRPADASGSPFTFTCVFTLPGTCVIASARACTFPEVRPSWSASAAAAELDMPIPVAALMNAARARSICAPTSSIDPPVLSSSAAARAPVDAMASRAASFARPFSVVMSRVAPFFSNAEVAASIAASNPRAASRCPRSAPPTFVIAETSSLICFADNPAWFPSSPSPAAPSRAELATPSFAAATASDAAACCCPDPIACSAAPIASASASRLACQLSISVWFAFVANPDAADIAMPSRVTASIRASIWARIVVRASPSPISACVTVSVE